MKAPIVDILLSIAADISSIISDMANSVDIPRWKPCLLIKLMNFFFISMLNSLQSLDFLLLSLLTTSINSSSAMGI